MQPKGPDFGSEGFNINPPDNGFTPSGFLLQNLNVNEVHNENHQNVENTSETYLHGMTVNGDQYHVRSNMNAAF